MTTTITATLAAPHSAVLRTERPVLGIVGGGQLGRMMIQAAAPLGIDVHVLAESHHDPAAVIWPNTTIGGADSDALAAFANTVDVLTFEHEHLDPEALAALDSTSAAIRPSAGTLRVTGDKLLHRARLAAEDVPVLPTQEVHDRSQLQAALDIFAPPVVLKARRGGFDGRGVRFAATDDAAHAAAAALGWPVLVEPSLDHQAELSVLVARRPGGEARLYPVIRTVQVDGTCRLAEAPSGVPAELEQCAQALALRAAHILDVVGILAVELFVVDGDLVVNEVAARPHNSGHLTIDACATSQFENHLRAVLDWPLGPTDQIVPAATMANVLAVDEWTWPHATVPEVLHEPGVRVHLYDKAPRPGRKIGHVTAVGDDLSISRAAAMAAAARLATGGSR